MQARRGTNDRRLLCAGPGRLAQALGVTAAHDGLSLDRPPFAWRSRREGIAVQAGTRIGISRGVETPWRFLLAGSRFVSRPLLRRPAATG